MSIEVNGVTIATTEAGHLENHLDWNEDVAQALAANEEHRADRRSTGT